MSTVEQRLYLLRHAESQTVTEDGRLRSGGDVPLTERGHQMARALAPYFAPLRLTRFHSSDQLRARQTAQKAGGEGVTVIAHAALREISVGDGEGQDAATAFAAVPGFLFDPDVAMPGGETPRQVRERAGRELDRLLGEEAGAPAVAIVGHGNMNRMLLSHMLGLELRNALRIRQDWAGVNVLERRDGAWSVGALNWNLGGMREFGLTRRVDGVAPEVWQRLGR
jgi:broad specificity phosphatase PhoE